MFTLNDDLSIYATRGDIVFFSVCANEDGEPYSFKAGDVVRIKIFGKKDAENVVLQKDFPITEDTTEVEIFLEKEDTKIGEVISKHKDYWYEIVLNDDTNPQTIIGYDDDGAKVFRLFPEGDDIPPFEPKPEDVRVMDDELDMTSTRPVQNQAVARAVTSLRADLDKTTAESALTKDRLDNLISIDDPTIEQNLEYLDYISEETKMKIGAEIKSDGVFATIKVNLREANLYYGGSGEDVFYIPKECRPIDTGLIHTEDGIEYSINYDGENYRLALVAQDDVLTAPSSAGTVTITYALGDYELKDIRVGADGKIYPTAGEAVREQIKSLKTTPQAFGAVGDGEADDTEALQFALNSGNQVVLMPGTYRITETLIVPTGCKISGDKNCIISPECEVAFHLKEKSALSGFSVNVNSENVVTVFEVNDNSTTKDSMVEILIENMSVSHSTKVMPEMYTVCHFHTTEKGIYNITVRGCSFDNYPAGGYVARVYSEGDSWLSTVIFEDNYSRAFKWHYFFDKSETELVNTHNGRHIVSNCVAQCNPITNGFVFMSVLDVVCVKNSVAWDWGSGGSGSVNCPGRPYVISANILKENTAFTKTTKLSDLGNTDNISVFDGTSFTNLPYSRHDVFASLGGQYCASLIPKFIGLSRDNAVCLYDGSNSQDNDNTRIRFYWVDARGITYVSIIPSTKKVFVSQPISASIHFGISKDNRRVYVYRDDGVKLPAYAGIMTIPTAGSSITMAINGGGSGMVERTPNCFNFIDKCYYSELPEEVEQLTLALAQPAYVSDDNGAIYRLNVVDDGNGKKELSITRAWEAQSEL